MYGCCCTILYQCCLGEGVSVHELSVTSSDPLYEYHLLPCSPPLRVCLCLADSLTSLPVNTIQMNIQYINGTHLAALNTLIFVYIIIITPAIRTPHYTNDTFYCPKGVWILPYTWYKIVHLFFGCVLFFADGKLLTVSFDTQLYAEFNSGVRKSLI